MADTIDTTTMPTPAQVRTLWERCDKALLEDRRHYWLNRAFFAGQQWVQWDRNTRRPEMLPDDKVGNLTVINKIGPFVENLMGRLLKRDMSFEAQASDSDDVAQRGAKLTEHILEADRRNQGWEDSRHVEVFGSLMGGTSAVCVEWDANQGHVVMNDPDSGDDLCLGGVKVTGLTIPEFSLEPHSRRQADARWWIKATVMTPEQAMDTFNLSKPPNADGMAPSSPLQGRLLTAVDGEKANSMCMALTMYRRPSNKGKGYVVTVVGDEVVASTNSWPFPFERLNIYVFRQLINPDAWNGTTFVTSARGPQFHYNCVRSVSLDHSQKVTNARLMVPEGYVDDVDEFTNETGEVIEFHIQDGNADAHWLSPPEYQRQLAQEAERIDTELSDLLHTHGTSMGQMVGSRNSGLAMSLVAEKDDGPLAVFARDQALGWGHVGSMAAQLYEANAIENRTTRVATPNGVVVKREWKGADIHGQTDVIVPLEATLPHSRVAHQAMMTNLAAQFPLMFQGIDPITMAKILDLPNLDNLPGILDPDRKRAAWENEMMCEERPCVPETWHNHAKHIAEHNAERNNPSYESWTPQAQSIMEMHIQAHEKMQAGQVADQAQLEQAAPGLSQLPQGDNPPGSAVPPPLSLIQGGQAGPSQGALPGQPFSSPAPGQPPSPLPKGMGG